MKIRKVEEKPIVIHVKKFFVRQAGKGGRDGSGDEATGMKKVLPYVKRQGEAAGQAAEKSADEVLDNVEGGEEIREAAGVVREATEPAGRMAWGLVLSEAERIRKRKRLKVKDSRRETVRAKKEDALKVRRKTVKRKDEGGTREKTEKGQTNRVKDSQRSYGEGAKHGCGRGRGAEGNVKAGGRQAGDFGAKSGTRSRDANERVAGGEAGKARIRKRKIDQYVREKRTSESRSGKTVKKLKDNLTKALKDKLKEVAPVLLGGFLCVMLLIAAAAAPIAGVVYVIYHSPLAIFLPPLESGDTVASVTAQYFAEYVRERQAEADNHPGFDLGKLSFWHDAEDYRGVMAVYVVKYGIGDVATVMNDRAKRNLKQVFDDAYTYSVIVTSTEVTTPVYGADGTVTYVTETKSVKEILIARKSWRVLGERYGFTDGQMQLLTQIMEDADALPDG